MNNTKRTPNALKWTEKNVTRHLRAIEKMGLETETRFIGRAIIRQGLYIDVWKYWKKKFAANDDMLELMLRIEDIYMTNLYEGALNKEVSPSIAEFSLKNNHHFNGAMEQDEEKAEEGVIIQLDNDTIIRAGEPEISGTYKKVSAAPAQLMLNEG
jgi:hypothetical protein